MLENERRSELQAISPTSVVTVTDRLETLIPDNHMIRVVDRSSMNTKSTGYLSLVNKRWFPRFNY